MEIEFNPNQMAPTPANRPVKAASGANGSTPAPALQGMAELQQQLDSIALTRPEKMEAARQALMDVKYPPEQLLNGIAHLLAIRLSN